MQKGNPGKSTVNQINNSIRKGNAPKSIERAYSPKVKGEQEHIHFKDGTAVNKDGTLKHDPKGTGHALTNKEKKFLQDYGWKIK